MLSRRSILLLGASGAASAAGAFCALAACGDGQDTPAATASRSPVAASGEPVPSAAPAGADAERLGQYRLPQKGTPGGLDWNPRGDLLAVTGTSQLALFPAGMATGGGGEPVARTAHGSAMATSVAWSPDGARFASVGTDNTLQFWTAAGEATHTVQVTGMQRHGVVRWSPAGNLVAVSSGSAPFLVDVSRSAPGPPVPGTDIEIVYELVWAPDGGSFYVVGVGGVSRLPAAAGQPLATLTDPAARVWRSVTVAPDGRVVVAARSNDSEDVIRVYSPDLTTPGPEFEISKDWSTVTAMRFSPDGRRIAIGFQHGPVGVWEVTGVLSRLVGSYHGHPETGVGAYGLAWQPGADRVASLDADGSIHLWRLRA